MRTLYSQPECETGRRVLNTYLLLFLHSFPSPKVTYDYEQITENALNTYVLGEHVGPQWGLPSVMKWRPVGLDENINAARLGRDASRSIGLYKVTGTTVEAVVGGMFHQFVRVSLLRNSLVYRKSNNVWPS